MGRKSLLVAILNAGSLTKLGFGYSLGPGKSMGGVIPNQLHLDDVCVMCEGEEWEKYKKLNRLCKYWLDQSLLCAQNWLQR